MLSTHLEFTYTGRQDGFAGSKQKTSTPSANPSCLPVYVNSRWIINGTHFPLLIGDVDFGLLLPASNDSILLEPYQFPTSAISALFAHPSVVPLLFMRTARTGVKIGND